jgi:hypothetical protein
MIHRALARADANTLESAPGHRKENVMGRARAAAVIIGVAIVGLWLAEQASSVEVRVPKPPKAEPKVKELKAGFAAPDLSELFNCDGITSAANRKDADFDEWKQSFDADELPAAGTFEPKDVKVPFIFPTKEAEKRNNVACAGQKIPVGIKAKQLHLLATATDGNQEDKMTLEYADGQVQAELKVSDWCQKAAFAEKVGVTCPSRVAIDVGGEGAHGKEKRETHIWVVSVPLEAARELKSVRLPYNSRIHVFALTLAK